MAKFEKVSRFKDVDLPIPTRATATSAGYDLCVAEDIKILPYDFYTTKIRDKFSQEKKDFFGNVNPFTLDEVMAATKELKAKPTLVSTGMKCSMAPNQYLELSMRSSVPLKTWLIMANGEGKIDSDYYNNNDNEGEIFVQIINLFPYAIELKRGDRIAQGIIKTYGVTDDDKAEGERTGGFGST